MWEQIDNLLAQAPHEHALRHHRVALLEARRRRVNGLDIGPLVSDQTAALVCELAVVPLLNRVRAAWDGPLVLHKGPEVALDYPGPRLRGFGDLDLLTDDAAGAQSALLAAGFREIDEEESFHHLRPLQWPGLPLTVELHSRPHWVERLPCPTMDELIASAGPSRLGVDGLATLTPAHHTLVLAAHGWAHDQLGRLGHLIDVAVSLQHVDEAEVAALARRWGCWRLWRTTRAAIGAVLEGTGRSTAVGLWARHLRAARERTVVEWHTKGMLAPIWGLQRRRVPAAVIARAWATATPDRLERPQGKLRRATLAVRNAGRARSDHLHTLDAGSSSVERLGG